MKAKFKVLVQLALYIITVGYGSPDAIGQSETKDYITYDTLYKIGYGGYEYRLRITRPRNMFTPGHADAAERPAIITMPGQGEMGTDYAKLRSYGPHYWLNRKSNGTIDSTAGWDGGIQLANGTHYPIYITMIASTTWPGAKENYQVLNYLLNTYHIKRNSVHLGGLSQGAMTWSSMILYEESAGAESGMSKVTSLVCLQGLSEELFQPALSWSRGPAGWGHWAKKYNGKFLGLEGTNDFRQIWACSRPMNDSVPGSAYFAYETFGNGGHCCWNSMYDPFRTNWTNTGTLAPNITTGAYANTPGTYYAPSSIFQWMLRQGDTALVVPQGTANIPPVAKAGSDISIALPLASITLNGSGSYDPDGTITSYSWQKISGPLTLNILDLTSVTTLVTGLLAGTYQFELTVKDDKNAIAKDTVSVNVSLLPDPTPTPDPPTNTFQWPTGNVRIWKVGPSEYKVGYLYTDGTLWSFNHLTGKIKYNFNGKRVKDVASCDFSRLAAVDEDGYVWMTKLGGGDDGDRIEVDTTGAPFDKNTAIAGHYQTNVTIREDGSLWYFGSDWYNLYAGTAVIKRPIQLSPAGMKVKKVVMGHRIVVLTESGEVWDWVKDGSRTPTKKNLPGPAFTIFTSQNDASGCLVPETAGSSMGYPYVWGSGNALWGGTVQYSTPTPLKSFWNLTMPLKEISANDQTIHYIDSLGRLFGVGDNSQGNIGSGVERVNQWDYASQYAWSFIFGELLTGNPPVEISPGVKFKKIYKNNTLGYFSYFQDERDSIYFVGRDKSLVGGRGWKNFDDATYANAWDVVKPLMVSPRYANFQQYTFAKGSANAGADRAVQTSSVTLSGSGTPTKFSYMGNLVNGLPSITYPISGYKWTKVSGGTAVITDPSKAVTTVTGLQTGSYVFRLVTTDTNSATFMDEVKITVNLASNQPPVSNAGPDINITLPVNSATLAGSGTDADGTIASYNWKYIDGPTQYTIGTPNAAQTQITNLVQGVYHFELIVTDNNGLTGSDIVTVNVSLAAPPNQPPVANAGGNKTITLPVNSVSLTGSGTDADGTISSYAWTLLDGPTQYAIASPAAAQTNINNLVQGIYRFQLKVTDDKGASSTDIVTVTVNAAPPPANVAPLAEAGANKTITLPVQTVTLQGSGTDNDGTIASYAWKQLSGPAQATILTPATASTVVNGLSVAGIYHFELTVTDDDGATGVDEVTVTVNAQPPVNQAPVVSAGANQVITLPVSQATVTGTANDPDGSIATYQWTWVSGPTQYTIASPGTAQTVINGLVQGMYRFQLRVTDNNGASATSIVQITVNPAVVPPNQLPTVDAGANIVITLPTNTANLSGTASDPDGTISTYAWTLVSGPAGAVIASPNTAQTAVNGLVQGVYYFELKVTDNRGGTATDVVTVTVNAAPPPPNQLPVAEAGQNISITLPTNSTTLTGSGTDADGTIVSYQWTYFDGPTQYTIVSPNAAQTVINNLVAGVYRFQLKVTDNRGGTGTDFVTVTVNPKPNAAPTAQAGNDVSIVLPVNFAVITGSGTDGDGTIASYLWTKVAGPGQFTIETPNAAQTRFSNLVAGTYTFQLEVKDNQGASGTDQVNIVVHPSNQLPVANAGVDVTITLPTSSLTISGVNSYDPDGTIVTYSWNKISGPTSYIMVTPNKSQTLVTTLVQGVYSFELTVVDNLGGVSKDTVKVTVNPGATPPQNQLPAVNAGNDIVLTLPQNTTQLFGVASDPDGTIASYQWTKVSGPASYTLSAAGSAQTQVSNLVAGVYVFELTAVDNAGGSSKDAVIITVNPATGNTNNIAPVADAGDDIQIKLPVSSVTLNGSGTDADGWITAYKWRKIEGPQQGDIITDDHASTVISNLTQGVYRFELTVTDDKGAIGKDTVEVKVTGDESKAGVYPNPVTDVLNVRIDAITQKNKTTIRIYDVKGVLVHHEEFMRDFPSIVHQVNVSRLMKGAYFITIGVDINVNKTIQFIKQ